jgi:streptogramin lyase
MTVLRSILVTAAGASALALTACGGGGGGATAPTIAQPVTPTVIHTSSPISGATAQVVFHIDAPTIATASTARRPAFVSPSTASVTIALQGQATPLATVNITPSSPGCATTSSGTQCSITVAAPVGTDTFVVTTWSGAGGSGSQLSSATTVATVVQNATNTVSMTLGGVVASATVLLGTTSVAVGTASSIAVNVVAYDAGGNIIIGPGNYTTPITVTDSDASGATSLAIVGQSSGTSVSVTAPGTSVTLAYTGGTLQAATITPSVGGVHGTAATFTPTGTATVTFSLQSSIEPDVIVTGPGNQVWYAGYAVIGTISSTGAVTNYTAGLSPNQISAIAGTPSGTTLWFADQAGNVGSVSPGGVTYLTAVSVPNGCGGDTTQSSPASTCGPVNAMVEDTAGNAWFTDAAGLIGSISPSGVATEWYIPNLPGWISGDLADPNQLILAPDGALYAADTNAYIDRITIANGVPTGVTQALNTICGSGPYALAAGPDGNIWFSDGCYNLGSVPYVSGGFSTSNVNTWSLAGVTGESGLYDLTGSPGGVWGIDQTNNVVYRIDNATVTPPGMVPSTPQPEITTVTPFGSICAYPYALGLGPNGNIWASDTGAIAKIVYGAPLLGSQSVIRKLPPATSKREKNAGARRPQYNANCD